MKPFFQFKLSLLGSISRTFGRIRMMRKVIIPLTFIGGFLTAIIIGIKITGVFNVILVTKVLMLQLALVLGKMIYGLKDIFLSKQQPQQPVYVSTPEHHYYHQPSHIPSYGQSSYGPSQPYGPSSSYNPSSSYGTSSYGSQSPYASNREDGLAPHYNSPQLNPINPLHNFNQPQTDFIQPQVSPFGGITLQTPQKIQYSPHFNQPFTRLGYVESLDQRILRENMIDDQPAFKSSMSPQELTKVLSDAIAQVSSRTTPSPLLRALKKRWPNITARNSIVSYLLYKFTFIYNRNVIERWWWFNDDHQLS